MVRGFASQKRKFHFNLMYGELNQPYDSNNMKIDKPKDPWLSETFLKTIDDQLEAKTIHFLSIGMVANE